MEGQLYFRTRVLFIYFYFFKKYISFCYLKSASSFGFIADLYLDQCCGLQAKAEMP